MKQSVLNKATDEDFERIEVVCKLSSSPYSTEQLWHILHNVDKYMELYELTHEPKKKHLNKGMKVCTRCKRELPLVDFYSNKLSPDGLQMICKGCYKEKYRCSQ